MEEGVQSEFIESWLNEGGTTISGIVYSSPSNAIAWGQPRCPLIPIQYRECLGNLKLPSRVSRFLGQRSDVLVSDLGTDWHLHLGVKSYNSLRPIHGWLYELPKLPNRTLLIPQAIPCAWILKLPLRKRLYNGLKKFFKEKNWDLICSPKTPLCWGELTEAWGIGKLSIIELMCVMESAELGRNNSCEKDDYDPAIHFHQRSTITQSDSYRKTSFTPSNSPPETSGKMRDALNILQSFALWAVAETEARSIKDAVSNKQFNGVQPRELSEFLDFELETFVNKPPHPYSILENWMKHLPEREKKMFINRMNSELTDRLTLHEMGVKFNLSRERVRQIEKKMFEKLNLFLQGEIGRPIAWRCKSIELKLGVAAPIEQVSDLLKPPDGVTDYGTILLKLAGYIQVDDWLVLKQARCFDPMNNLKSLTDENGQIDLSRTTQALNQWGLPEILHERWLMKDGKVLKMPSGHFYLKGEKAGDRIVAMLAELGRPASIRMLMDYGQEKASERYVRSAIDADKRVVRVSRNEFGLRSWNNFEYPGVAKSIHNLLLENGAKMHIYSIASLLSNNFDIPENTTRTYCLNAPMFISDGELVRLRKSDDPFEYKDVSLRKTKGVFKLGSRRVALLLEINPDILRGSGQRLTFAAGKILGVRPNENISFINESGNEVIVTFPDTSISGPALGSIRSLIDDKRAEQGDILTVVLDRNSMSVSTEITKAPECSRNWDTVARLTGIDASRQISGLADALGCESGQTRSILVARGDERVVKVLPEEKISPGLDKALKQLEQQVFLTK